MPVKSSARTRAIPTGTQVVSSTLCVPTRLLAKPTDSSAGTPVQPGTPLKVVANRAGWHEVETLTIPKARGWVSTTKGPTLAPQVTVPSCDVDLIEFGPVDGKAFTGSVAVKDINQGYLGDCYLMAALTTLANSCPSAIQDTIREGDEPGSYVVTLPRGIKFGSRTGPKSVKVDHWYPMRFGHLVYAQGGSKDEPHTLVDLFKKKKRAMWPAIIEKAIATMAGGYDKIVGGFEGNIIEAFTGYTAKEFNVGKLGSADNEGSMKILKMAVDRGLPIAAATKPSKDEFVIPGIFPSHVYVPVGHSKDKIILRNPHDARKTKAISYAEFSQAFDRLTVGV